MGSTKMGSAAIGVHRKGGGRIVTIGISRIVVPRRVDTNVGRDERSILVGALSALNVCSGSSQGTFRGRMLRSFESMGHHKGIVGMPTGGGRGARVKDRVGGMHQGRDREHGRSAAH